MDSLNDLDLDRSDPSATWTSNDAGRHVLEIHVPQVNDMAAIRTLVRAVPLLLLYRFLRLGSHDVLSRAEKFQLATLDFSCTVHESPS